MFRWLIARMFGPAMAYPADAQAAIDACIRDYHEERRTHEETRVLGRVRSAAGFAGGGDGGRKLELIEAKRCGRAVRAAGRVNHQETTDDCNKA